MATIDIDFDLFKELTIRRTSEDETISDVIRKILAASSSTGFVHSEDEPTQAAVVFAGTIFPEGTIFEATYKGRTYYAKIKDGAWRDSAGAIRTSPSDAARAVTNTNVNGWRFWKAKRPGDPTFRFLEQLREK